MLLDWFGEDSWESLELQRSNQSILKEISPEFSLEGLMLKLKLQYFGHLLWHADSFEKALMLGKIEAGGEGDDRGWDGWMASLTHWTWVWVNSGSWWWTERPCVLQSRGGKESNTTGQLNWTDSFAYNLNYPNSLEQDGRHVEILWWVLIMTLTGIQVIGQKSKKS